MEDSLIEFQQLERKVQERSHDDSLSMMLPEQLKYKQCQAKEQEAELSQTFEHASALEAQGPTLVDELEALKQQRDAQELLIENLRVQVQLGEERALALI